LVRLLSVEDGADAVKCLPVGGVDKTPQGVSPANAIEVKAKVKTEVATICFRDFMVTDS
jgi:hypothetical protein